VLQRSARGTTPFELWVGGFAKASSTDCFALLDSAFEADLIMGIKKARQISDGPKRERYFS